MKPVKLELYSLGGRYLMSKIREYGYSYIRFDSPLISLFTFRFIIDTKIQMKITGKTTLLGW